MKPNTRASSKPAPKPCPLCQLVRRFLLAAGFLLLAIWLQPGWRLPAHIDYTSLVGDLFLAAFVLVFAWKFWLYRRDLGAQTQRDQTMDTASSSGVAARTAAQARARAALADATPMPKPTQVPVRTAPTEED